MRKKSYESYARTSGRLSINVFVLPAINRFRFIVLRDGTATNIIQTRFGRDARQTRSYRPSVNHYVLHTYYYASGPTDGFDSEILSRRRVKK